MDDSREAILRKWFIWTLDFFLVYFITLLFWVKCCNKASGLFLFLLFGWDVFIIFLKLFKKGNFLKT